MQQTISSLHASSSHLDDSSSSSVLAAAAGHLVGESRSKEQSGPLKIAKL
jgi:hypothetical protein